MISLRNVLRLNWPATLALNCKAGGMKACLRMPIKVYGKLKWHVGGRIQLPPNAPRNTLIIGSDHEDYTASCGRAELNIRGTWRIEGVVRIGPDCFVGVKENAELRMHDGVFIGRDSQIHCSRRITFGQDVLAAELYATDSTEHYIYVDDVKHPKEGEVTVGRGACLCVRAMLLKGCVVPPFSVVAAGAVCTKDYGKEHSGNILLAGIPAEVRKTNIRAEK